MLMTSPALADAGIPDPSRLKAHMAFLKDRNFKCDTRSLVGVVLTIKEGTASRNVSGLQFLAK